jgi:sepiapterin reductase
MFAYSPMSTQHHLVIITGANRGFGASVAHSYVAHSGANAVSFVLVGRNKEALDTVLKELRDAGSDKNVAVQGAVIGDVDLGDAEALDDNLARIQASTKYLRLNVLVCCSMVAMVWAVLS